jgi:hypothetical protein
MEIIQTALLTLLVCSILYGTSWLLSEENTSVDLIASFLLER